MLLLSLLACVADEPAPPPVAEQPAPAPAPPPTPAPTAAPGPLWVRTADALVRVDASGGAPVIGLPGQVTAFALAPDGTPWVAVGRAVLRVDGTAATPMFEATSDQAQLDLEGLAIAADGRVWATGPYALLSWSEADGVAAVPRDQLGPDGISLEQVAVGGGRVVVRGRHHALRRLPDGTFAVDDLAAVASGLEFTGDLTLTDDAAYISFVAEESKGVLALHDAAWTPAGFQVAFDTDDDTLAVAPGGALVALAPNDRTLTRDLAGTPTALELGDRMLAREAAGVVVDARDRVWARTDRGLLRWDPDGTVTEYAAGTAGLPVGELTGLAVHAGGPDLGAPDVLRADVTGSLRQHGDFLRGAPVALCDSSGLMFTTHPCEAAAVRHDATTDDVGAYTFSGVAQGSYDLLVKTGDGTWSHLLGASCCRRMVPGEPVQLGEIALRD